MKKHIAILPGDGIGPEIVREVVRLLRTIGEKFGHEFELEEGLIGAAAINQTGEALPQATLDLCTRSDAVLFGAIGDPKYDNDPSAPVRPEQGLLALRKGLGLYANIRPVQSFPSLIDHSPLKNDRLKNGVDLVVYRELTGGIYFGEPRGRDEGGQRAFDTCVYTKAEVERIARKAFEYAGTRRKKVTSVDKANVLETSRLWRETVNEVARDFPDIELEHLFVDNAAMQVVQAPEQFDVLLTGNMFGDILSDETSILTGSLGLLPSASIGEKAALFEPVHGSYPQAAGKDIANPLAMTLSLALLLDMGLGLQEEADLVRKAVDDAMEKEVVTEDLTSGKAFKTSEVGDHLLRFVEAMAPTGTTA